MLNIHRIGQYYQIQKTSWYNSTVQQGTCIWNCLVYFYLKYKSRVVDNSKVFKEELGSAGSNFNAEVTLLYLRTLQRRACIGHNSGSY